MPAGATVMVGNGLTVILTVAVLLHPLAPVPVTEYVVDTIGFAVGLVQVVQDKPVPGDHR